MMRFLLFLFAATAAALQTLPPVQWFETSDGNSSGFSISATTKTIYIDESFASRKDQNGLTLIPPSAYEFAKTFQHDLEEVTSTKWNLERVKDLSDGREGILLGGFRGPKDNLTYEDGTETEEAYELEIKSNAVYIGGSGARGMYWGTQTLLQLLLINTEEEIPAGQTVDAPAYATRGFMLDAGRKWYEPSFLKDLCTYGSFFKMSEFHYHTSDNYPLSRGHNETWNEVYSQFSLLPEDEELHGIIQRKNETLSRADFGDLQQHCAARGVTVIPEIEAPGHCLFITKWKPELALEKKDLLNLTHPDSIPVIKSIWAEFLPWFQTKEVHIGADEYDPTLADDYINFVNEMARFVKSESGKNIRIWGTHEPSENLTISQDIIIQHWQYGQSDPLALEKDGYQFINSEDWWAYMSLKNDHMPIIPAPYPQFFNNTRVLNFADKEGWQWEPSLFNPVNETEQVKPGAKGNKGAILAAWNDNGVDATTQLEAYYAIRNGIPVVAARAWAGANGKELDISSLPEAIDVLTTEAPAQNLDRRLAIEEDNEPLISWSSESGNKAPGYGSKGMNYTLVLQTTGPFKLRSNDTALSLSESGSLVFTSDNWDYPLRSVAEDDGFDPGHPGRIWTNVSSSTHETVTVPLSSQITIETDPFSGSRVWVDDEFVGRFEVFVFGGKNTLFSWSQMAFVAPLDNIEGDGLKSLTLGSENDSETAPPGSGPDTQPPNSAASSGGLWKTETALVLLTCLLGCGVLTM